MSVIGEAKERRDKRGAVDTPDGTNYSRTYFVQTDSDADGADTVLSAPGLPKLFDSYKTGNDTNVNSLVRTRTPKNIGRLLWDVEIGYTSDRPDGESPKPGQENVLLWEPIVSVSFETFQVVATKPQGFLAYHTVLGANGTGIVNSAGEVFDPPVMVDDSRMVLTIQKNYPTYDEKLAEKYTNTVNSDVFFGGAKRQWKMQGITTPGKASQELGDAIIFYYPITFELHFARETWDLELLDIGTFFIDKAENTKLAFTTDDGQPRLGLLDGKNGFKLPAGKEPQFVNYHYYTELPFGIAAFALPQTMP